MNDEQGDALVAILHGLGSGYSFHEANYTRHEIIRRRGFVAETRLPRSQGVEFVRERDWTVLYVGWQMLLEWPSRHALDLIRREFAER